MIAFNPDGSVSLRTGMIAECTLNYFIAGGPEQGVLLMSAQFSNGGILEHAMAGEKMKFPMRGVPNLTYVNLEARDRIYFAPDGRPLLEKTIESRGEDFVILDNCPMAHDKKWSIISAVGDCKPSLRLRLSNGSAIILKLESITPSGSTDKPQLKNVHFSTGEEVFGNQTVIQSALVFVINGRLDSLDTYYFKNGWSVMPAAIQSQWAIDFILAE